jgi:lipoprotein-anchoring transpeptidase ErfK/SrfK
MSAGYTLEIDISSQSLEVRDVAGERISGYPVSSAKNGAGEIVDSGCTPTGKHIVRAKIGAGEPVNTVFRGRRPTGEIYQAGMRDDQPGRDWILTRILWLSGTEPGINRLGNVDTMQRFIYIHGTPDEVELGRPGSHGCIRMRNGDVLELFEMIAVGTRVMIHA